MNEGRELDARIADQVIGVKFNVLIMPYYSTSLSDAWLVVEHMQRKEYEVDLIFTPSNGWSVTFNGPTYGMACEATESLPHLICLAALKAVQP